MLTPENLREFLELHKKYRKLQKKADKYKWLYDMKININGEITTHYLSEYEYESPAYTVISEGWGIRTPKGWMWRDIPYELYLVKEQSEEQWMIEEVERQHQAKWSSDFDFAIKEAMENE